MSKEHRLLSRKKTIQTKPLPLNFLLGCSQRSLQEFYLARLAEISDLQKEIQELWGRVHNAMTQAAIAHWFESQDRQTLKHSIDHEETPEEWAARMVRDGQRAPEELLPLLTLPPGEAHRAAAVRYAQRNMAEGKCSICPEPLDRNSVRYCTKHLAAARTKSARQRGAKGEPGSRDYLYDEIPESTHGRQPGTLASLAMNREKATRALLMERGIKPENAAVSLNAAIEALARIMPRSQDKALTQPDLFQFAGVITKTTGQRALQAMMDAGAIERIGTGIKSRPYRYWRKP